MIYLKNESKEEHCISMKWTPVSHFLHAFHSPTPAPANELAKAQEAALIDTFHPARLLPSELLQEIFTLFIEDTMSPTFEELATGDFVDIRDLHAGPWLLSRVSSRWRSIVFAMPRLWARINVNLDREKPAHRTLYNSLNKFPEEKSRYHVNIYSQRIDIEHDAILCLSCLGSYYWRSLGLSLPGAAFFRLRYSAPWDIYGSLEDVRLHIQSPMPEELPMVPRYGQCCMLNRAPHLRSLMVNNVVAFRHIFRVPWNLITRFELAGSVERAFQDHFASVYVTALHELLGKLVHLEYANLHPGGDELAWTVQPLVQNYENASLRYLTLGMVGAGIRDELLLHTDMPSLEILHFADSSMEDFPRPLGPRTGKSIRELSIYMSEEDVSSLFAFLRSTPNVRNLEIRTMVSLDHVGTSILDEDELVPHLETLRIRGPQETSVLKVMRASNGEAQVQRSPPLRE